jgi:hypothetical protein
MKINFPFLITCVTILSSSFSYLTAQEMSLGVQIGSNYSTLG